MNVEMRNTLVTAVLSVLNIALLKVLLFLVYDGLLVNFVDMCDLICDVIFKMFRSDNERTFRVLRKLLVSALLVDLEPWLLACCRDKEAGR